MESIVFLCLQPLFQEQWQLFFTETKKKSELLVKNQQGDYQSSQLGSNKEKKLLQEWKNKLL